MNLTGSRPTLIANLCALVAASVVTAEMHYIEYVRFGMFRLTDTLGVFIPALVMFVIRNRIFSYSFLFFYVALSIQMFFQVIYLGVDKVPPSEKTPFPHLQMLFLISICSLAIYAAGALI